MADGLRRRDVVRAGAGAALALGAAGCGIDRTGATGRKATERVVAAKPDGDLVLFNWAEYLEPKLFESFERRYGVKVRESNFDSLQGMVAKLRAGNRYDLIFPSAEYADRLIRADLLLRIDPEKLRNAGQVYDFFADPWYDPGSQHTVPYAMYTTGVCWRVDRIDGMTGSWNDLTHPDGEGRTFMLDDFQEAIGQANYLNGFKLNAAEPAQLERSKRTLLQQKGNLRGYSSDDINNLLGGAAWIHHAWNGDVVNLRNQAKKPENFRYETCREGVPVGSDTMAIPVTAPHPGTALLFVDWMLDPENAAANIAYFGYPMPNKGAAGAFSALVKDDPAIDVTIEDLRNGEQFRDLGREGKRRWDRLWTELKAA